MQLLHQPELEAHNIKGFSFGLLDEVRFFELDALNHVNNTVCFRWAETLRLKALPLYGISDFSENAPKAVIRTQRAEYFAPLHLYQHYIIAFRHTRLGRSSFEHSYEIHLLDEEGKSLKKAISLEISMVLMAADMSASQALDATMRETIAKIDGLDI